MEFKGWTGMRSGRSTGMVVMAMNCWWKLPDRLFLFCCFFFFFHIHHLISIGKNSSFTPHSQSCSCNTLRQIQAQAGRLTPVARPHRTLLSTVTFLRAPACDADHPQTPKLSFESCSPPPLLEQNPPQLHREPQADPELPKMPRIPHGIPVSFSRSL